MCAGFPPDPGLTSAYVSRNFSGMGVHLVDEMCQLMQQTIHDTGLEYAVVKGQLWLRSSSKSLPWGLDDAERLADVLESLLSIEPFAEVQMLVTLGDQPTFGKAELGAGLHLLSPSCASTYWCIAMPSPFHIARVLDEATPPPNGTKISWGKRTPAAWWRGQLSVTDLTLPSSLLSLPRLRVISYAKERPELMDVRLSGLDYHSLQLAFAPHRSSRPGSARSLFCSPQG